MSGQHRERLAVPASEAGVRLDLYLVQSLAGVSRKAVKKALDGGRVFIDGRCERRAGALLRGGELLVVSFEAPAVPPESPPPMHILYRDSELLAIDKPANLPAHPTVAGRENALGRVTALLKEEGRTAPPILLHRLDADTTGVLLFALTEDANRGLYRQFAGREVEKTYLALVAGTPPAAFVVANHLKAGVRGRTVAVSSGGQPAETAFRTLAWGEGVALVEATPKTGRTHQIRVHLAGAGYPLLGDTLYGGPDQVQFPGGRLLLRRHLLHAWRLTLRHPLSGERLLLEAPIPADFTTILPAPA